MREIKVTFLRTHTTTANGEREREKAKGIIIHMFTSYTAFTASSNQFFKSNITTYVTRLILQGGRVSHMSFK
jgi:hypothetical protein